LFFSLFSVLRAIAEWVPGTTPKYHLPLSLVVAGQHAKILGASIADKVLFTGTAHVPLHAKLVIVAAVAVSMVTTFLTIRQSQKRGMMPAATPDNPMASSQKYMTYIMPFFALTGLYWPFGLVLYWVTTNVWTLGQQWILGLRYPYTPPAAADAAGAPAPAAARSLTGGASRARPVKGGTAKAVTGTQGGQANGTQQSRTQPGRTQQGGGKTSRPAANGASANGAPASGGGVLKRLGRARSEPEPQPELPEVKLVRHQTQRQSRSKRSGKH
jgi:YidC/Oxa1 family membrane protein insertase